MDAPGLLIGLGNLPWLRRSGKLLLAISIMLVATQDALALDWGEEYAQRIKATELTQPLGDSTFGDQINLFNGTVSFSATDISLPGNARGRGYNER